MAAFSGRRDEAELARRPEDDLLTDPREVRVEHRHRVEIVEREVTIGDRVDRVPHLAGGRGQPERRAGEGTGTEWALGRSCCGCGEPRSVAIEHLDPREQVMPERHRLPTLQVRVAREKRVGLLLCERENDERECLDPFPGFGARIENVEAKRRCDLIVARAPGMDLPAELPEQALDRAVDVLVRVEVRRRVDGDLGQSRLHVGELGVGQQAGRVEPLRVLDARLAVVGQELRVVGVQEGPDRRVERPVDTPRPEGHPAAPSARWAASSACSSAADVPSLTAMKMVLSPASVPAIAGWPPSSIACANALA